MIPQAGTNIGQGLVTGVPFGLVQSTYAIGIASITTPTSAEGVLVSSAGAATYTYLCGCVFTNTTATNGTVFIQSPGGSTTNLIAIGVPANDVPAGLWPGCENPFFRSPPNSSIYLYQNVSTTANQAIYARCNYYQGP